MNQILRLAALFLVAFAPRGFSADLDVPGAKSRYEAQRRVADAAQSKTNSLYQILQDAERRLSSAEQAEGQAISDRDTAENRLRDLDREIADLDNQAATVDQNLQTARQRMADVGNRLQLKWQERDRLSTQINNIDDRIREIDQKIAANPNPQQLQDLQQRRAKQVQLREDASRRYNDAVSQANSLQWEHNQLDSSVQSYATNLQNIRDRIASLRWDRDQQIRVVQNAQDEVRRARSRTDAARIEVSGARPPYQTAKAESDFQERLAQDAYAYYQQVVAAYNAALNEVYLRADAEAAVGGGKEASDRAPGPGSADGDRVGRTEGTAKARRDAAARDYFKGYFEGRLVASTEAALAASYKEGTAAGEVAARAKAHLESFPKGYNEALRAHLGALPAGSATVDISQNISSNAGGSGNQLKLTDLKVGQGQNVSVVTPKEPTIGAPVAGSPSIVVPASLKAYYSPPCSGLVLAEFEPLCRSRYDASYLSEFNSAYRRVYRQEYGRSYDVGATASYQSTLAGTDGAAFAQGRGVGAKDQGLLDGFAKTEPVLQQEEHGLGKAAMTAELRKGAYLVVREVRLEESSGDGLFTPGEPLKVSLVVDNYGLEDTALGKVRARVTGSTGLGAFNFTVRDLPALAANTRTTLTGVVASPVTTEAPKEKIQLEVALDVDVGQGFKEYVKARTERETGFPLELTDIVLPKNPKVGEKVEAKFKFKNRTTADFANVKADLDSSPQFVTFTKPQIDLPAIAAGAEAEVPVEISPGPWVGDNTYVRFLSQFTFSDGRTMKQALKKFITVDRPVALLLYDTNGAEIPSSTVRVKAGSSVSIQVLLKFKATSSLPGPFIIRESKLSNPLIGHGNGSTTSVNYGSLSPGTTLSKIRMIYTFPTSLQGKSEYVMIQAEEGSKVQHALMVYFDIY